PKGEHEVSEDALVAARREFSEELGQPAPGGDLHELGGFRQPSGKIVTVWAVEGECDVSAVRSNTFRLEWPPRSGRHVEFPEVDRAEWFTLAEAERRILPGQRATLERFAELSPGWGVDQSRS
ncbi:MAG: NUDIX domain-containing protein, partial [Acidimicrobiales bacterium]